MIVVLVFQNGKRIRHKLRNRDMVVLEWFSEPWQSWIEGWNCFIYSEFFFSLFFHYLTFQEIPGHPGQEIRNTNRSKDLKCVRGHSASRDTWGLLGHLWHDNTPTAELWSRAHVR